MGDAGLSRRSLLTVSAVLATGAVLPSPLRAAVPGGPEYVAAYGTDDGRFGFSIFDAQGNVRIDRPLPGRAHAGAFDSGRGHLAVFARRPGQFLHIIDVQSGDTLHEVRPVTGRRLCGHGQFTPDGSHLLATENDYEAARGVIGIYDRRNGYRRVGEIDTGGTGPHEMLLTDDGRTAVVANGGIETHPDYGRRKLNLSTMEPSVALIDLAGNMPARQFRAPEALHQLSLRHLAIDADGVVWIGGQFEGDPTETPPLAARLDPRREDGALEMLPQVSGFRNYIGSVAVSADRRHVAMTAPRADRALVIDPARGGIAEKRYDLPGICGVAGHESGFLFTAPGGDIRDFQAGTGRIIGDRRWDNHLLRLG
jgi:hypothetical protein